MQHKVTEVFYDDDSDSFGSYLIKPDDYSIDDLYRITAELICLLSDIYEAIGKRRIQ